MLGVRYPSGREERARDPAGRERPVAFCGVSVLSPELPGLMTEQGAFSIIPVYLRLIRAGRRIATRDIDGALWMDIGTPESLEAASAALGDGGTG